MMLKKRNLKLNLLNGELVLSCFMISNFENRLLASIQIITPRNIIEKMKIYRLLKLIRNNNDNKIIDVIILLNKFCDIKYYQNFV